MAFEFDLLISTGRWLAQARFRAWVSEGYVMDATPTQRLYTMSQAAAATFACGPLAGAILLAQNYRQLGAPTLARRAVIFGLLSVALLFPIALILPESLPNAVLPVGYTLIFRALAEKLQGVQVKARLEAGAERHSWWRTIGMSLAALVVTVAVFLSGFFAFDMLSAE